MEMTAIMMGSMSQPAVVGSRQPVDVSSQASGQDATEKPGFGSLFAQKVSAAAEGSDVSAEASTGDLTPSPRTVSIPAADLTRLLEVGSPDLPMDGNPMLNADQLFKALGKLMTEGHGKATPSGKAVAEDSADENDLLAVLDNLVSQGSPQALSLLKQVAQLGSTASGLEKPGSEESEKAVTGEASVQDVGGLLAALSATLNKMLQQNKDQSVAPSDTGSEIPSQSASLFASVTHFEEAGEMPDWKGSQASIPGFASISSGMLAGRIEESVTSGTQDISKPGLTLGRPAQGSFNATMLMAQNVSGQGLAQEQVVEAPAESGSNESAIMELTETMEVLISDTSQMQEQQSSMDRHAGSELLKRELFHPGLIHVASQEEPLQIAASDQPMVSNGSGRVSSDQILDQVRSKLADHRIDPDNGQVTLRLHPLDLGELKISVRMDDQRLRVEIVAENRTVKDALMQNMDSLKESLARLNMQMERFDVTTGSRQFFNQGFREGRQNNDQQAVPRHASWLTGRSAEQNQSADISVWQPRENALLDMVM